MEITQFNLIAEKMVQDEMDILRRKGEEYRCGDPDVLANFKRLGKLLGLPLEKVWATYLMKHIDAINNRVRTGQIISDESIQKRINDARNYLLIGYAIFDEPPTLS